MNRPTAVSSLILTFLLFSGIAYFSLIHKSKLIEITITLPKEEKVEFTNGVPSNIQMKVPLDIPKENTLVLCVREAHGKSEEIKRIQNVQPGSTISEEWIPDLHGEEDEDEDRYWFTTQLVDARNHPLSELTESNRFYLYE